MEYFVRQPVDCTSGRESWALIDKQCMPELDDGRMCEEDDVKAVASSRAELELKMASMGLALRGIDSFCRAVSTETWTAWTVGKIEDDG